MSFLHVLYTLISGAYIALDIVHATKDYFYSMFTELKEENKDNWL